MMLLCTYYESKHECSKSLLVVLNTIKLFGVIHVCTVKRGNQCPKKENLLTCILAKKAGKVSEQENIQRLWQILFPLSPFYNTIFGLQLAQILRMRFCLKRGTNWQRWALEPKLYSCRKLPKKVRDPLTSYIKPHTICKLPDSFLKDEYITTSVHIRKWGGFLKHKLHLICSEKKYCTKITFQKL